MMYQVPEMLRARLCFPKNMDDTAANVIRTLLEENVLNPKDKNRKMPLTGFRSEVAESCIIHFELAEPENLFEVVGKLCRENSLQLKRVGDILVLSG